MGSSWSLDHRPSVFRRENWSGVAEKKNLCSLARPPKSDEHHKRSNRKETCPRQCTDGPILGGRYRLGVNIVSLFIINPRYQIVVCIAGRILGCGSSGTVFVGWDSIEKQRVAIKRLDANAYWERRRECALASSREYRCIRKSQFFVCPQAVIGTDPQGCDDKGDCYVVMELQGGLTLSVSFKLF
jgi:hypothetical protein